jgi:hypothetical protein
MTKYGLNWLIFATEYNNPFLFLAVVSSVALSSPSQLGHFVVNYFSSLSFSTITCSYSSLPPAPSVFFGAED